MALRQQRNNTIVLMKHQVCFAMRWRGDDERDAW
jgi:hypothetical protein